LAEPFAAANELNYKTEKTMNDTLALTAVDVSKESLEIKTDQHSFSVPNTKKGLSRLLRKVNTAENPFVICEATGGYERLLMHTMQDADIPICRANPARIRAFAKSEGVRAKTDPIDARMILKFAQEKQLRPTIPMEPERKRLAAYLDRRTHLKDEAVREKNRIQNSPEEIHAAINRMLQVLKAEIDLIEEMIRETVNSHALIAAQVECLKQIKGVGEVTAWVIIAFLGEIDKLTRNQLVALAGVAPFNRDSGIFKGKRKIIGGRAKVRTTLYMATQTAARHNPVINKYVEGLLSRGKPYKCAMVAAMRKLLIHMQSELKNLQLEVAV
jgi:transposase